MPSSSEQVHITLPLLIRFLTGLSAYKLPTQAQFSNILLAALNSPVLDPAGHPEQQPDLIRSLSRFLAIVRKLTDLNNKENQFQRLIYALVTQSPQASIPTISTTSPSALFKRVLLTSLGIPKDTFKILDNGLKLVIDFFQTPASKDDDQAIKTSQEVADKLVTELVKFLISLHHHIGNVLEEEVHSFYKSLSHDLESFQVNQEFRDIVNLFGECVSGFFGTTVYWNSLTAGFHELGELFTENKDELLKPLKKLQLVISNLFENFDDQLYSPKLYDNLRSVLEELKSSTGLIAKPTKDIVGTLEAMRLRAMEDDQSWRELVVAFEQVSTDFIKSVHFASLPRQAAGSLAKAAFYTTIEYIIPRLLLLMNEIPSPRIEFVSPTIDAVFDPASFTSTSGFLPSSISSTSVLRFEMSKRSTHEAANGHTSQHREQSSDQLAVRLATKQRIAINGLRVMSKNVGFYFHKKVNPEKNYISKTFDFTNFEDEGKLDVFLGMGNEDGLSLDFELDWNAFHLSQKADGFSDSNHDHHQNGTKPDGLFTIEKFRVDLKGFGIFPHNTNHPVLNWFLKPGLEPYLHAKLIHVLEEYLLDQLSKLNNLLGKMRARWEEGVDSGVNNWANFFAVMKVLGSSSDEDEETDPPTSSQMDSTGLTIEAEDKSYAIRIGIGQKMLPGKGLGGPAKFQERLGMMRDEVGAAIDSGVSEIVTGIAQATIDADRAGWQSTLFDCKI